MTRTREATVPQARMCLVLLLAAAFVTISLGGPARAEQCEGVGDTVRSAPAGQTVCPEPTPPEPTPDPQPTPTPTRAAPTPAPRKQTATRPRVQVLGVEIARSLVAPPAQQIFPSPPPEPLGDERSEYFPQASITGPGLGTDPQGTGSPYLIRVAVLLFMAGAGTLWLQQARVRASMIGFGAD